MASLLKKSLEEFNKKSIFPWVNAYRRKKKDEIIREFFDGAQIDDSYSYDNIKPLAELYQHLKNLYDVKLPNVRDTRIGHTVYLTPRISRVITGNNYVEMHIAFDADRDLNGNLSDNYPTLFEYRFIFRRNGDADIRRRQHFNKLNVTETVTNEITSHHGVILASYEWYLVRHSFINAVLYLMNQYFNDN